MWWVILISSVVFLLMWILIVPFILFVDTNRNRYILTLPGIFRAAVIPADGLFRIRIWVFFIPFTFDPFISKGEKKKKGKHVKTPVKITVRNRKTRMGILARSRMAVSAMRAIRIRRLELDIDTDDFMLNAWLIPAFSAVNSEQVRMRANFTGQASLLLDLRIRLVSIVWVLILSRIRS